MYALDTTWELHKPYLQKSSLLSALLRRAEKSGMKNIEEEEEEQQKPGEIMIGDWRATLMGTQWSVHKRQSAVLQFNLHRGYYMAVQWYIYLIDLVVDNLL